MTQASNSKRIDGEALAGQRLARVAGQVATLVDAHALTPGLAVVLVGSDPASQIYVRNKHRQTVAAGMHSYLHQLPDTTSQAQLLALIAELNADPCVHGILVQLPLPARISPAAVLAAIDPDKDVDGFHEVNIGRLWRGDDGPVPCTPMACRLLLHHVLGENLSGLEAVVLGRSNIVGKPLANLLLREDCTVTLAHSKTRDLPALCARADILVAAVGRPEMVTAEWVKPGATVIDVGINRIHDDAATKPRLVGDVAYDDVSRVAAAITPVPGGVGPMTIACLLDNTVAAACRQHGLTVPDADQTQAPTDDARRHYCA
ncbi:bifunctional methylenetetrahydrofolate dehydrogenase/methenyltetrahydrofolate cyclohydrolase FolD [Salinisphaera aquimarina]|uniref:Bifunctional protein FolD n=1 Tax=Salinisphaera aquimarina TaxID=2094031 RepID=A0ABV7EU75_9GAMM